LVSDCPSRRSSTRCPELKAQLKVGPESAAEAILTTDTHIKVASRSVKLASKRTGG
jgi:N-acetylglutamate synthase/N-acetylornithine aminotransferase